MVDHPSVGPPARPEVLRLRRRVYEIVEPGVRASMAATLFGWCSITAILVSIADVVTGTVGSVASTLMGELALIEAVAGAFFATEYLLRLWVAAEHPLFGRRGAWRAAMAAARTPLMLLDALGLLPLVLALVAPRAAGLILMLQVLRFFRLARYSPGLATVGRVLAAEWRALTATAMIGVGLLLLAATALYILEREVQPDKFSSIPQAGWWAIVTLATVGYGDVVPVTDAGKVAASLVIVAGLVFFALPIAIISSSFLAEVRRRDFNISYSMVARVPLFAGLDALEIAELAGLLTSRRVPRDAVIVKRGDPGDCMFFIARGSVEVILPGGPVVLEEGQFFGEIAVIDRTPRTATVIARRSCDLLVLDSGDLMKLTVKNPHVRAALEAAIAARRAAPVS